jgi:hypothetical protein
MLAAVAMLAASGCVTSLVGEDSRSTATIVSHCSGSEWQDNSSIAALPIPIVAFFSPHADLNEVNADTVLRRCGEPARMVNRRVDENTTACVPAALTRIVTLGVWQWCPVHVSWDADVTRPPADVSRQR